MNFFELDICYHPGGGGTAGAAHDEAHRIASLIQRTSSWNEDDVESFPAACYVVYTDRQLKTRGHTEFDGVLPDGLIKDLTDIIRSKNF